MAQRIRCPLCGELAETAFDEFEVAETHYIHLINHQGKWSSKKCIVLHSALAAPARWQETATKKTRYTEMFVNKEQA